MTVADLIDVADVAHEPLITLPRRRRVGWIAAPGLAIATAGAGAWAMHVRSAVPAPHYITAAVSTGTVAQSVETTGTVQPLVQVQVSSQVSGRVQRVLVDFNSRVHTGDVLAELDTAPLQAQLDQARGALTVAQGNLARAQSDAATAARNLTRETDLRARNLDARADLDAVRGTRTSSLGAVTAAQGSVAQARAALQSAQANLTYAVIRSPIDGVVITRAVDPGATVAASLAAPTLFVIANDMTHMQVLADVQEASIGPLRAGLTADVHVDAFRDEVFHGTVREVRYAPTTTSGVVTYPAVIDVANPAGELRPGMTATVTIATAQHTGTLRVPNAALRFHPARAAGATTAHAAGTRTTSASSGRLYVLRDGIATPVRVHVGLTDGTFTEVSGEGLATGTAVVVEQTDAASARPAANANAGSTPSPLGGGTARAGGGGRRPL